ncbi:MAG: FHA domain-containing protein [Gemmataceae bacterium]
MSRSCSWSRHQECDVQIPSRRYRDRHCCIAHTDDHLVIRDLFSTNGIRINGTKLDEGILRDGDEVTIGNFCYRVEYRAKKSNEPIAGSVKARAEGSPRRHEDAAISLDNPVVIFDDQASAPVGLPIVLPVNKDHHKPHGFSDDFGNMPVSESPSQH